MCPWDKRNNFAEWREEPTADTKEDANLHPPTPPAQNAEADTSGVA